MRITPYNVKKSWGVTNILMYIESPSGEPLTLAIHWVCFYMIKVRNK